MPLVAFSFAKLVWAHLIMFENEQVELVKTTSVMEQKSSFLTKKLQKLKNFDLSL